VTHAGFEARVGAAPVIPTGAAIRAPPCNSCGPTQQGIFPGMTTIETRAHHSRCLEQRPAEHTGSAEDRIAGDSGGNYALRSNAAVSVWSGRIVG
jgi:hypothetical protein